jgi:hypothetical protein
VALSGYSSLERYETICTRSSVSIPEEVGGGEAEGAVLE